MQRILLAWPNRTPDATLSGPAWSTASPLAHLQTRFSFEVARSVDTDPANTQLDVALDRVRGVRVIALLRHNMTVAGRYRVRASDSPGAYDTPKADTGLAPVWPSVNPFGTTEWGDEGWWGGKPAAEDLAGYPTILLVVLPSVVRARYWRIELFDETNPAGYIEASRLWIGGAWQPRYNMSYGHRLGWDDPSKIESALDGTEYVDERVKTRLFYASLDWLSHDESLARYLEMERQLGVTRELLVVPDADDALHLIRRSFVGRLKQLSAVESYALGLNKGSVEIKETV